MDELAQVPDWDFVIDTVLPRLGMWTGQKTYVHMVAFLQGFDLAKGGRLHPLLQDWATARFGPSRPELGWPSKIVYLVIGTPEDGEPSPREATSLTPVEDAAAMDLLEQAVQDVRAHLT